jgi:hypothetical protein
MASAARLNLPCFVHVRQLTTASCLAQRVPCGLRFASHEFVHQHAQRDRLLRPPCTAAAPRAPGVWSLCRPCTVWRSAYTARSEYGSLAPRFAADSLLDIAIPIRPILSGSSQLGHRGESLPGISSIDSFGNRPGWCEPCAVPGCVPGFLG